MHGGRGLPDRLDLGRVPLAADDELLLARAAVDAAPAASTKTPNATTFPRRTPLDASLTAHSMSLG